MRPGRLEHMFVNTLAELSGSPTSGPESAVCVPDIQSWADGLLAVDRAVTDAQRIDQLRALEVLKAAACAAQARISVDFERSQRAEQEAAGVRPAEASRGIGAQIALARRESPHQGNRLLGLAKALVEDMPLTLRALERGRLNEWRATILVKGTACLAREDRESVDSTICRDAEAVSRLGNRRLEAAVKTEAYRLDPHSIVERSARAANERRVSLRPAPDTMTYLTALLPVAQGVAAYAALTQASDAARAAGDDRGRGQVMADTLVQLITGQETADAVPVQVNLVMTDKSLLAGSGETGSDEPGHLVGFGPLPAEHARRLVKRAPAASRWVRRLYASPATGQLVAMDSHSRRFPAALADFLMLRDQTCRTPWCDAPIRHSDHAVDHALGGATSAANGQGLCEACNHTKQVRGWRARPSPGPGGAAHTVETTTPTGHTYTSTAPDPPRANQIRSRPAE